MLYIVIPHHILFPSYIHTVHFLPGSSCTKTETLSNDGIDNDCDFLIDEELLNGVDDDGDGLIDEDVATNEFYGDIRVSKRDFELANCLVNSLQH